MCQFVAGASIQCVVNAATCHRAVSAMSRYVMIATICLCANTVRNSFARIVHVSVYESSYMIAFSIYHKYTHLDLFIKCSPYDSL